MGGRKPTSPKIVPGKFPTPEGGPAPIGGLIGGVIGGRGPFGGRRRPRAPQRPPTRGLPPGLGPIGDPPPQMTEEERQEFIRICPDPNMNILMADGSQKRAGDLVVGDLVKTYHEKDLEKTSKKSLVLASGGSEKYSQLREELENSYAKATLGEYKVEFVDIIKNVEKIKLTFEGSEIICSLSHKLYVNDSWKEVKDMVVGDEVSGKKLVAIESVEDGDVVHITVKDAHTYICEGLLSHNKGLGLPPRDPSIGKPPRGRRRRPRNSCPDPSMTILMSDDTQKRAGDLVVGDLVKTNHEKSLELGNYEVEFVDIIKDVEKIKLTFEGSEIICSLTHKFYVDNIWKEAKDMVVGDVVSDKKLTAIEKVEDGDVVHITVKDAHTYICEGLLSHNKRFAPGYGPRGPRVPTPPRGDVTPPGFPSDGPRIPIMPKPRPRPRPRPDDLGPPPEREVPIPKEVLPEITREFDPTGPAPFAPNEEAMAKERFYETMSEKRDFGRQQKSMQQEERARIKKSRLDEVRMRMSEPGEIDINAGRRRRRSGRRRRMMSEEGRARFRDNFARRFRRR